MKRLLKVTTIISAILIMVGCVAPQSFRAVPQNTNAYFSAALIPFASTDMSYDSFVLSISNRTNQDLEIDWNRTFYIANGATDGTFMFKGILFRDRNNQKSSDIVFANSTFKKTIYPNNLVSFISSHSTWYHEWLKEGRHGIYLNVKVKGKEVKRKIYVEIYKKQK